MERVGIRIWVRPVQLFAAGRAHFGWVSELRGTKISTLYVNRYCTIVAEDGPFYDYFIIINIRSNSSSSSTTTILRLLLALHSVLFQDIR